MNKKSAVLESHHNTMIRRSIGDVYRFVAVDFFQNYRKWSPEVSELQQTTTGPMRVGMTGRQVRYDQGYRSEAEFRVTQMTALRELRFASLSRPEFEACYRFEPVATDTLISFDFKLRLPVVMLPFRERVEQFVEQGGNRVVSNIRTLLHQ